MIPLTEETRLLLAPLRLRDSDRIELELDRDGDRFICHVYAIDPISGNKTWASNAARHEFFARVPERMSVKTPAAFCESWLLAATDFTVGVIDALWPVHQRVIDEDAQTIFDYHRMTLAATDTAVTMRARYDENHEVPPGELALREDRKLSPYQQLATKMAMGSDGFALFMEQGTGKSAVVVTRVCEEARKAKGVYKVIIVCPKNVRSNWVNEFDMFGTVPGSVTVLRGGPHDRVKSLIEALVPNGDNKYSVVVCSYECMTKMAKAFTSVPWDLAVLDEGHYIKWPLTQRSKASVILRDAARQRMVLTGTPVCNSPLDVYSQFEFLAAGRSGFLSWENFRKFFGKFEKTQHGDKLVGIQNVAFMRERFARHSFIITKKEALPDLPDKLYDIVETEMTEDQQEAYDLLKNELVMECETILAEEENQAIAVNNVLVKLLKLSQITSGFLVIPEQVDVTGEVISAKYTKTFGTPPKLDSLVEILREDHARDPNSKAIIWANWVHDIKTIKSRLDSEMIPGVTFYGATSEQDRVRAVEAFNSDPTCKYLVGNAAAGGTGINLLGYTGDQETHCDHVIYYSQDWSGPKRWQSEDRAHRRGTKGIVRVTDLCVPNTIDEEIRRRVVNKKTVAMAISDVRSLIRAVLGKV